MASSTFSGFGVLALGFFAWKQGLISFSNTPKSDTTPEWARQLQAHYNDETTQLLTEIRDGMRRLIEYMNKQGQNIEKIIYRNEEVDKYGVKIRKS